MHLPQVHLLDKDPLVVWTTPAEVVSAVELHGHDLVEGRAHLLELLGREHAQELDVAVLLVEAHLFVSDRIACRHRPSPSPPRCYRPHCTTTVSRPSRCPTFASVCA